METRDIETAVESLKKITGLNAELLALCRQEKEMIVYENVTGLADLVIKKEEVLNKMALEKITLKNSVALIKAALGFGEKDEANLLTLSKFFPEEYKLKVQSLESELKEYVNAVRTISLVNRKLISDSLKFINFVIDFIKKPSGEIETYLPEGKVMKRSNERAFLDVTL